MTARKVPGVDSRKNRPKQVQTMESLLARTTEEGDCLLWQGYVGNGVPQVSHGGKVVSVRRLMLEMMGRVVKPTDFTPARCGCRTCVEPSHIVQRTHQQHAIAMLKAPRNETVRVAKLQAYKRTHSAKLTLEQAREIRSSPETGAALARQYGVDKSLVSMIRLGKSWREMTSPFAGLGAR